MERFEKRPDGAFQTEVQFDSSLQFSVSSFVGWKNGQEVNERSEVHNRSNFRFGFPIEKSDFSMDHRTKRRSVGPVSSFALREHRLLYITLLMS
jgi:hypothetical protein